MYIVVVSFILFFVGCGANMNSFNVNVEGTVDYQNNANNNNTNSNTNNNTNNANTNNNTNSGTNSNTNSNTNNNTNNTNNTTNTNLTDNLGTQLSTKIGLEVAAGSGVPVTGANSVTIQVYTDYLTLTYPITLTKVKYSQDIASITTEGIISGTMARVPANSKFIKLYFEQDGDSVSKIYEVPANASGTLPSS